MSSTWDPEELRRRINSYAPYVGARIEVTFVSEDASEVRVQMPLEEDNANLVGTHFGGSLYAMIDPHLMLLFMQRLGPEYVVWDRAASIEFLKPGRGTVHSTIIISDTTVEEIRERTRTGERYLRSFVVEVLDDEEDVVMRAEKTLYFRRRS